MAEVSSVVDVTASLIASAVARRDFGSVMYVFEGTEVAAATTVTKAALDIRAVQLGVNTWATNNELQRSGNEAFAAQANAARSEPARAGEVYFAQDPLPKPLKTAGWFVSGAAAHLLGSPITSFTDIAALGTSADIEVEGNSVAVTSLSSATDGATAAGTLQTAVRTATGFSGATVQFTAENRFLVSVPIADQANFTQGLTGANAVTFGLDASATVPAAQRATFYPGLDAENLTTALNRIRDTDSSFYFLTLSPGIEGTDANQQTASTWVGSNASFLLLGNGASGATILDATNTTHVWSVMFAASGGAPRAAAIYSESAQWKALAWAGIYSGVNFDAVDSLITGNLKQLRGTTTNPITADQLSSTQISTLEGKRINYFTPFGSTGRTQEGWSLADTANPSWIDAQYFIDWFTNAIQTSIFNLLTREGRVPLTNRGLAQIRGEIISVFAEARSNGGIAPLSVSNGLRDIIRNRTGNNSFDGFLNDGALVWHPLISSLNQQQRENRTAPIFYIWAKLTGAVHNVEVQIVLEN